MGRARTDIDIGKRRPGGRLSSNDLLSQLPCPFLEFIPEVPAVGTGNPFGCDVLELLFRGKTVTVHEYRQLTELNVGILPNRPDFSGRGIASGYDSVKNAIVSSECSGQSFGTFDDFITYLQRVEMADEGLTWFYDEQSHRRAPELFLPLHTLVSEKSSVNPPARGEIWYNSAIMIHLFYGTDSIASRSAALKRVDDCLEQGCRLERLEAGDLSPGRIADMAGAVSLFGEETVYLIDTPSEDEDKFALLLGSLPVLGTSNNTIVVIERTVLAPIKKQFEKVDTTITEYKASAAPSTYDPFLINNALVARDKKTLWMLFCRSVALQIPVEETVGIIWWQLKTLRLASMYPTADAAGMKSFPYDKAKRALRNFKPGEVEELSRSLLRVYHEARAGKLDMVLGMEGWVLQS